MKFSSDSPGAVKTCWPSPEVSENLGLLSGTRGVTDQKKIIVFIETLTRGTAP